MVKSKLGWDKALEHAKSLYGDGSITREQELEIFRNFYNSQKEQDLLIAVALLSQFIKKHEADFDQDFSLEDIIKYGNTLCRSHPTAFGDEVLYPVLGKRSIPAKWVDRIADEESAGLREAFVTAVEELAKREKQDLDRVLGFASYFMDDPAKSVRDALVLVFIEVAARDKERLHYFLVEFQENAGTNRLALINSVRENIGSE